MWPRPLWKSAIGRPQVDQMLHGLKLAGLQHVQRGGCKKEVAEATVELLFEVKVVEGRDEMIPIQMRVDSENLPEDQLSCTCKLPWESTPTAEPLAADWLGEGIRACWWGVVWMIEEGNALGVGREHGHIIDFARDPALHEGQVFVGRQVYGLMILIEPSIGAVPFLHVSVQEAEGREAERLVQSLLSS